jgi:dCTP deaminase
MIYSDCKFRELQDEYGIVLPFRPENLGASSYDLTLLDEFLIPQEQYKVHMDEHFPYVFRKTKKYWLPPGGFILGSTEEVINIPVERVGFIEGRSSIGRRGLFVQNAGFCDMGFNGRITLELFNASPSGFVLEAGRRICQLVLMEAYRCELPYGKREGSKYQDQTTVTGSRLEKDLKGGGK